MRQYGWWQELRCLLGFHVYVPAYETRRRSRRGVGTVMQYRCDCHCCGAVTDWMSKAEFQAFNDKHKPSWGK